MPTTPTYSGGNPCTTKNANCKTTLKIKLHVPVHCFKRQLQPFLTLFSKSSEAWWLLQRFVGMYFPSVPWAWGLAKLQSMSCGLNPSDLTFQRLHQSSLFQTVWRKKWKRYGGWLPVSKIQTKLFSMNYKWRSAKANIIIMATSPEAQTTMQQNLGWLFLKKKKKYFLQNKKCWGILRFLLFSNTSFFGISCFWKQDFAKTERIEWGLHSV